MIDVYLRNLAKVLSIGGSFAAIPLLLSMAALEPPWPPAIAYVSAALVLVSSLVAWEWTRVARKQVRRKWIIIGFIIMLSALLPYLVLYSFYIEVIPGTSVRVIRGYVCTRDALLVYHDACPDLSRDALRDAEWEAPMLWTRGSITVVRMLLTVTWLGFIAGLITTVGAIIAGRRMGGTQQ